VGEHKEHFKDNSERDKARFSTGVNPLREEASFEQLLGQLDLQGSQPAAECNVTGLFSLLRERAGQDPTAPTQPDAEQQRRPALATPNMNSTEESKSSEVPAPAAQTASPALRQQETRSEAPGDFTRIFTKLATPRTAQPAILSELPAAKPPALLSTPREDSFTQFFQTIEPATASTADQARSSAQPRSSEATEPLAKVVHNSSETSPASPPRSIASAEFAPTPSSSFSGPVRNHPASRRFTELLNALGSDRTPSARNAPDEASFSPARPSAASPARRSDEARISTDPSSAQSSAAPRPGEFTQLLQNLQRPSESKPESSLAPIVLPPAQAPFVERDAAASNPSSAISSDFTRVMKSAAARANSAPSPVSTPLQNGVAAGLPISAPPVLQQLPPAALPVAPVRTALEKLAPWLLVMNGVLLALLVLLTSLLLLRHHQ
jgi:hypothetical protein